MPGSGSAFTPQPIHTTSAAQQIAGQIRAGVLRGELSPGDRLPSEAELAVQYDVSRGTIRETMKLLEAQGLVVSTRGAAGGTFVRLPEPAQMANTIGDTITLWFNAGNTSVAEVNTAREIIERGCVTLAATQRTEPDLDRLRTAVEAMERPGLEMDDMLAIDIDFHDAVCRAAHNAVMELAMNALHIVRPYTNTMIMPVLSIETIAAQHRTIFEAIEAQDADAAQAGFDIHMAYLAEVRAEVLADQRPEDIQVANLTEAHPAVDRVRTGLQMP